MGVTQLTLITSSFFKRPYFEELLLPASRYSDAEVEYVDISQEAAVSDHVDLVVSALRRRPGSVCLACSDAEMEVYSAAVEVMRKRGGGGGGGGRQPRGANFRCFWIATNKLACRDLIAACSDVRHAAVSTSDRCLPDLGDGGGGFFKPLADWYSNGVFRYAAGRAAANPVRGREQGARLVSDPLMAELAAPYEELRPYLDPTVGGIAEEYVDPASCSAVVSIDGYVWRGRAVRFCVSDNTNVEGAEGALDSIVTPTQRLSEREVEACWAKFDAVLADFVRRGADGQFVNVEAFVLTSSGGERVEVKVVEVNFRPVGFFMPVLPKLHRGADMFSAAIDMLLGKEPLLTSPPGTVVHNFDESSGVLDSNWHEADADLYDVTTQMEAAAESA